VVIVCEQCQTRFRLDDERIPRQGANVRCSKCKASFFVQAPGASQEEALEEVVAQATDPGTPAGPEFTRDLFETESGRDLSAMGETRAGDDEAWEFNDDPKPAAASPEPAIRDDFEPGDLGLGPDEAPAAASAPAAFDLDAASAPGAGFDLDAASDAGFELGHADDFGERPDEPPAADAAAQAQAEPVPDSAAAEATAEAVTDFASDPAAAADTAGADDFELDDGSGDAPDLAGMHLEGAWTDEGDATPSVAAAAGGDGAASGVAAAEGVEERPEAGTDEPVLDELGTPDQWDFLGDGNGSGPASAPALDAAADASESAVSSLATSGALDSGGPAVQRVSGGWLGIASWALAVSLTVFGVVGALPVAAPVWSARAQPAQSTGAGTASDLQGRFVENAWLGPMFLVSGRFEPEAGGAPVALRVRWRGASDALLREPGAIAGAPISAASLRELPPEVLVDRLARRAVGVSRGGRFQAVFEQVPPAATDFVILAEPLPRPRAGDGRVAAGAGVGSVVAAPEAPGPGAATTPSRR
jgi:predicted Zn finger-like uncharacterized protein